ncbi:MULTISPECIES: peptigoglycan-binding protein LysM [unclassified Embleya]|uniref:CIS tube protein n=1 Tax=unclassified Embleya TaxID=2699296 RepID=UPI003403A190
MTVMERATITNSVTGARTRVLFNPEDYTINRDTTYAQLPVPGLSAPIVQFVHGNAQTLEMELFLDSLEANDQAGAGSDVRILVRRIVDLMDIDPTLHAPPPLVFAWAGLTFTCVLTRVVQKFVMFKPDGTPVRARLTVSFSEFRNVDMEAKEVKRQTSDYTKAHTVVAGESVQSIAWREYGSASAWRPIALHNGLDDPRVLPVGATLQLPRLPYRDPATNEVFDAPPREVPA